MPTPPIVASAMDAARRHQAYTLSGSLVLLATARRFLSMSGGRYHPASRFGHATTGGLGCAPWVRV